MQKEWQCRDRDETLYAVLIDMFSRLACSLLLLLKLSL
ncbi:MAG: hypothetical protein JWP38_1953 [Herbaspirillum sp.]|jgi:hypothetical protein|nr:hypothetical protein [Herbaspirillum sp.]